jgi:hypothetical protein
VENFAGAAPRLQFRTHPSHVIVTRRVWRSAVHRLQGHSQRQQAAFHIQRHKVSPSRQVFHGAGAAFTSTGIHAAMQPLHVANSCSCSHALLSNFSGR